jgi:hypothetical protein
MSSPAVSRHRPAARPQDGPLPSPQPPAPRTGLEPVEAITRVAGRYRYDRHSSTWWWSPEMFTLHGLAPQATEPCTEVLLEHLHTEDRARTVAAITSACTTARAFSLEIRVVRADGEHRSVVFLGEPDLDPDGHVSAVEGMCIDITDCRLPGSETEQAHALQTEVVQLRAAMASRAAIEQAKGILMLLTSCGDQVAFDLLAHISSHTHRKVRDVAQSITESAAGHARLPDDVRAILRDACPPAQPLR